MSDIMHPLADPVTHRAEEIREITAVSWERACQRAERERDAIALGAEIIGFDGRPLRF